MGRQSVSPLSSLTPGVRDKSMGLPRTPTMRVITIPNEDLIDSGYDSDFQIGPFLEEDVFDEMFATMEEKAPEPKEDIVEGSNDEEQAVPQVPKLLDGDMNKMKVLELRVEFERRGSKHGLKATLLARLEEAVINGVPLVEERFESKVENNAGDTF